MSSRQRRRFKPEEKLAIVRRHLLEEVPVSDLCDEYGIQPTVFYRWQKQLFDSYTLVARLLPAFVSLLPLFVLWFYVAQRVQLA